VHLAHLAAFNPREILTLENPRIGEGNAEQSTIIDMETNLSLIYIVYNKYSNNSQESTRSLAGDLRDSAE